MNKKLKNTGDCYEVAGRIALQGVTEINGEKFNGKPYLVHAEVKGPLLNRLFSEQSCTGHSSAHFFSSNSSFFPFDRIWNSSPFSFAAHQSAAVRYLCAFPPFESRMAASIVVYFILPSPTRPMESSLVATARLRASISRYFIVNIHLQ